MPRHRRPRTMQEVLDSDDDLPARTRAKMLDQYITLKGVQTHLITWGDPFEYNGRDVIIIIAGNPGLSDFYIEFATEMYANMGLATIILGQAGHEEVPDKKSNKLAGQEHLFGLEGQLLHKMSIFELFDDRQQFSLIGHSIGAWMILEMVDRYPDLLKRVRTVSLLFPTIQKIAETKNGIAINNTARKVHWCVMLIFYFVYYMPYPIKLVVLILYMKCFGVPHYWTARMLKYANPRVGEKMLHLAYEELDKVKELNVAALEKIKDITYVIYGSHDNWAPRAYMESLKQFEPDIVLEEVPFEHNFMMKSFEQVSEYVSHFMKKKMYPNY